MNRLLWAIVLLLSSTSMVWADDDEPSAAPKMVVETKDGDMETTDYSGSAPIVAHFTANPVNADNYTLRYEWRVCRAGQEKNPYLVRYDRDFDYTFLESGKSVISLDITFYQGSDSVASFQLNPSFSISADESILNVPNAFSPNGDGANDYFQVKSDHRSIIEFHGYIFNRWGKKLYEWTSIEKPEDGWDGKYNGCDVADGVYFCRIDAKGAEGKVYKFRKAINLLRGYKLDTDSGSSDTSE